MHEYSDVQEVVCVGLSLLFISLPRLSLFMLLLSNLHWLLQTATSAMLESELLYAVTSNFEVATFSDTCHQTRRNFI